MTCLRKKMRLIHHVLPKRLNYTKKMRRGIHDAF